MRRAAAILSTLGGIAVSSLASAGPLVDAATRAEALEAQGNTVEALAALEEAMDALWADAPLGFRAVELVETAGDGERTVRTDRSFEPDETMTVYVEPVGYAFGTPGADDSVAFTVGLVIENATGQILVDSPAAFNVASARARDNRAFGMTLSVPVPFIRPGDYTALFNVDDQNSDKTAEFEVPFTVVLPGSGAEDAEPAPQ